MLLIDPELMIRMLIVGYCYGIRFERKLCEEVKLHLGYRWFCRVELDDNVPDHSTFSVNRYGRFRDSDIFRQMFEAVVRACMDAGLVKGEGFAVDASVMEADASQAPDRRGRIMRYELSDEEWTAIKPMLPNKPRGVPRVNDRRVLNGIFWVLRSGAPWRELPNNFGPYIHDLLQSFRSLATSWRLGQDYERTRRGS
jgi:Transposase domain (DUF772)/Putative transposase of IS4/5 family (DUF4096)